MRHLKQGLFVVLALLVTWRIISLGIGQYFTSQAKQNEDAALSALVWSPGQPSAAFQAAGQLIPTHPEQADSLLLKSLQGNPADGRVLVTLGKIWRERGDFDRADQVARQAARLLPSDAYTQLQVALHWFYRGKLSIAMEKWDSAIQAAPSLKAQLFPLFLNWAEEPQHIASFRPITSNPPPWWDDFFTYAVNNASRLETIQNLYKLRSEAPAPFSNIERRVYMERLRKDGYWAQAFMAWLNSMDVEEFANLGPPFNGSFETDLSGLGFGWHVEKNTGELVETDHTYGTRGERALHLVFLGEAVRFRHLYQPLFLNPARYRLTGRVRPDNLQTTGGLRWNIDCAAHAKRILAESERFVGVDQWRAFTINFVVPESGCGGQTLQLITDAKSREDAVVSGSIWFDDLRIERF